MIVLDTDVLSIVQHGRGVLFDAIANRLDEADDEVYLAIITFEEQMRGWLAKIAHARALPAQVTAYSRLWDLLEDFRHRPVLKFDQLAAREFAALRDLKLRISTMDLRIASIVLANDALLISRNLSDFERVPGLRVEDWTIAS